MSGTVTHKSRRPCRRREYVHLGATARLANGERHVFIVRLNRKTNVLEFRPRRSRLRYEMSLGDALTILARYLDKQAVERELRTRPSLPIGPRML